MKAYQITQFGLDYLRQVEIPVPTPGAGEVLIRVHAVSLNYRDLMMIRGQYDPRLRFPRVPLSDGAGEIVAIGTGVTRFRTGDRVMGLFLQNWQDGAPSSEKTRGALGGDLDGMLAEYVVLPERGVVHFPPHLTYEQAATLPCAALTAWHALFEATSIRPGDTVLIQGTGGVSIFALQFAGMAGARVLGISSRDEKIARAKTLGLDRGVNYMQQPEWAKWVREQTGDQGGDLIVEVGGAGTWNQSLKAVRVGGAVAQIGVLSGGNEIVSVTPILMRQIRIFGIHVGSRAMMERMNRAIENRRLVPIVDKVFPFDEATAAFRYLESGRHFGKVVIAVNGK
jgi:NADPH:quinone reductase-like Zn-dependent oxidoreductase